MIRLVCDNCGSNKICYLDKSSTMESYRDNFYCEDCGQEFSFMEAAWEQE